MVSEDVEKIRAFEKEVLDKVYAEFPFFQYSDDVGIPYLLQMYGDMERHFGRLIEEGHEETQLSFFLHNFMHGLSHCIRWVKMPNKSKYASINDTQLAHNLAMDFANWGISYHTIAQEFIAWSRGLKSALIDDINKTVTFTLPDKYDYSMVFTQQMRYKKQLLDIHESYPHREIELEFEEWFKDIDLANPPIANSMKWWRARRSSIYPLILSKIKEIVFPELHEETEFGGYTLAQLRQFYTLFYLNFYFIRWVEFVIDSQKGVDHSFGSNPLYLEYNQFMVLANMITGLPIDVVSEIIKDLTFDGSSFHSTISIQPFVQSNSGVFYILPNLFYLSEPARMIVGALNKGAKKPIYDRLITTIEQSALNELVSLFATNINLRCFKERRVKLNNELIEPDLLIIDMRLQVLLIADYKHFVGPISASEVDYRMKGLQKAIQQVERYIKIIGQLDKIDNIQIQDYEIIGMIITYKPLPIPIPQKTDVLITDVRAVTDKLNATGDFQIATFVKALKSLRTERHENNFTEVDAEIKVKDWTVIRKMIKIK